MNIEQVQKLLQQHENVDLEFKTARDSFSEQTVIDYCAGLANNEGGYLILGIDNQKHVVGSQAFKDNYNTLPNKIFTVTQLNVQVEEIFFPAGQRILVFVIPPHKTGTPVRSSGKFKYPIRRGESLCEMDDITFRNIINESDSDFSDEIMPDLTLNDLDEGSLQICKEKLAKKSGISEYKLYSHTKLLKALNLQNRKGQLKRAALILFGKKEALDELLPAAEIIFEWREKPHQISYDFRQTWRDSFFKTSDAIWETINARNKVTPFKEGMYINEIHAFPQEIIREAVLNAVSHRDYRMIGSSILIKANPEIIEVRSPGGLPFGITLQNILHEQKSRNRRIAEVFAATGLVERSGQGMDTIFSRCIKDGKGLPDLSETTNNSVIIKVPAQIKDKKFITFLELIQQHFNQQLSVEDCLELEKIRTNSDSISIQNRNKFLKMGIIEKIGRGRASRYVLSGKYYEYMGKRGQYTKVVGLSRETKKELILQHIRHNKKGYAADIIDALSPVTPKLVNNLLQELRRANKIKSNGRGKSSFWTLVD